MYTFKRGSTELPAAPPSESPGDAFLSSQEWMMFEAPLNLPPATSTPKQEVDLASEGTKYDSGKLPWELYAWDAAEGTVDILAYGAQKYARRNWELGMDWSRVYGALMRHMVAWWQGEDNDPETGKSHLDHAAACIMFLQAYSKRGAGTDDRPR